MSLFSYLFVTFGFTPRATFSSLFSLLLRQGLEGQGRGGEALRKFGVANSPLAADLRLTSHPCFFRFPCFFSFSALFLCAFFLPFPEILRVPRREKPLLFSEFPLLLFFPCQKGRVGGSGRTGANFVLVAENMVTKAFCAHRLVSNHLGHSTARLWCYTVVSKLIADRDLSWEN